MKTLRLYYIIFMNLLKLSKLNENCLITNATAQDQMDLATGRWNRYKQVKTPDFTIGMDKDVESILFQYTFFKIGNGKQLTGPQHLEQITLMAKICDDCYTAGKLLIDYINEL